MRITFATGIYPPDIGGPATYVSHLAKDLFDKGWQLSVVTYGEETENEPTFPVERVSRSAALPSRYLSFATAVRRASQATDLIYAQDPLSSGLPALVAARTLRRPFAVKIVGDLAWEIGSEQGRVKDDIQSFQNRKYGSVINGARRVEHFVARSAKRVIVPSGYLKDLVTGWGVPAERIDIVHNSLPDIGDIGNTGPAREAARRELSFGEDTVLIAAGRLVPWKRFDQLIRLIPEIRSRVPSVKLLIIGSGPDGRMLKDLVSELNLTDVVSFPGPLDARGMRLRLAASDALVLASTYEGFSHLLLEAMRSELPIVATDAGGNHEVIENGRSGILVPLGQSRRLTEALVEVCSNPTLRATLMTGGAARAKEFAWERMVDGTVAALQRALSP